jgi:outer membrane protein assembly factor BamB
MRKRRIAVMFYVVFALVSSYCVIKRPWQKHNFSQNFSPAWRMPLGDAQNTGRGMASHARGELAWSRQLDFKVTCSVPLIDAENMVYAISGDMSIDFDTAYKVYAFDSKTGKERWHINAGGVFSLPYLHHNLVLGRNRHLYVLSTHGDVYAVDTRDGSFSWQSKISSDPGDSILDEKGILYVPCGDGILYAIDPNDGQILWKKWLPGRSRGPLAISPDNALLYATCALWNPTTSVDNQTLYALDCKSGQPRWSQAIVGETPVTPVVGKEGTVFVNLPQLTALDGKTGAIRVIVPQQMPAQSLIEMIDTHGTAYAYEEAHQRMHRFDSVTGKRLPSFALPKKAVSNFVISANGTIYYGDVQNDLCAIDSADGTPLWKRPVGSPGVRTLSIGPDGAVYTIDRSGKLYKFN